MDFKIADTQYPGTHTMEVDTPIGKASLVSWGHSFVVRIEHATINRVDYSVSFHPVRKDDGSYGRKDHHTLNINKNDSVKMYDYTAAAYDKALDVLTTWINEFVTAHPEIVKAGFVQTAKHNVYHAATNYDKARSEAQIKAVAYEEAVSALAEAEK